MSDEKYNKISNKEHFLRDVPVGSRVIRLRGNSVIAELCIHAANENGLLVTKWGEETTPVVYSWKHLFHFTHVLLDINQEPALIVREDSKKNMANQGFFRGQVLRVREVNSKLFVDYVVLSDSPSSESSMTLERQGNIDTRVQSWLIHVDKFMFFRGRHVSLVISNRPLYEPKRNVTMNSLVVGEVNATPKPKTKPKQKKFILWCPTSDRPPRVILEDGLEHAKGVAADMANRHGTEFFVCELVAKAARKQKVTYSTVVVDV